MKPQDCLVRTEVRLRRIVDTSSTLFGAGATQLYFTVWNTTENHRVPVIVSELDGDGKISRFDDIFILRLKAGNIVITKKALLLK